ncbi:hypothetical protein L226DRAFT_372475 [Lentinus tigrinus ALCF2SS1-7]|uniref:F-box domain-containing protein n=1 Tax=Lentinus tigrinus ALCF2SS1-6 TaxID=1328759 RepID=A0A5C2SKE4_9APHY|nr:hypothetical protein L227DRAFT_317771 [Lentinus tigrinus ALCF2SS1-6]RPD76299.1 hypothetical protein L226DRAFT_372475 [Lentinus tigrinus ALCF2SS1-7]
MQGLYDPPHGGRGTIPFDIFAMLLQLLDIRADVRALMLARKDIYAEGARRLLKFPITISDDRGLVSLCQFILRDPLDRAPGLRQLHISIPLKLRHFFEEYRVYRDDPELRGVPLLLRVLPKVTRLEDLSIDWCEEFLERDNGLIPLIASLGTLRRLCISSFGLLSCDLLASLRSPLQELEVDCWMSDIGCWGKEAIPLAGLMAIIHGHSQTLEILIVWFSSHVESRDATRGWYQQLREFPCLHSLSLRSPGEVDLELLVGLFPNLRSLNITDIWGVEDADVENMHDDNMEQPCWPSLEEVSGDVDALHALGLTSSVRRVDATCPLNYDSDREWRLHQFLGQTGPTHLFLHFGYDIRNHYGYTSEDETWALDDRDAFANLLDSATRSEKLTHLALDICLNLETLEDSPSLLNILLEVWRDQQSHHLTFLVLRLDTSLPGVNTAPGEEEIDDIDAASAKDCFAPFFQHPASCAEDLALAIPTLMYVSLQIKSSSPAFWRAHRTGDRLQMENIDPTEGQKLATSEGLDFAQRIFGEPSRYSFDEYDLLHCTVEYPRGVSS